MLIKEVFQRDHGVQGGHTQNVDAISSLASVLALP